MGTMTMTSAARPSGSRPWGPQAHLRVVAPGVRAAVPESVQRDQVPALRLTRRGRLVVIVLAVLLALAVGSVAQQAFAGTPDAAVRVTAYTVQAGETLWQIAGAIAEPGEDVRDVIHGLMVLNGLSSSGVQAGQQLLIPAP